ncbi:MAG: bifunctional phosphoribosyl-AMP cyclohydrolase/phosphoribosyl-ATP diphosphatase HisIE [Bacillota bacterium]|nr:bifunctional phosphoribosyl-AMP cyclohydrolase/phosphoribosyl-ATP diphosphatase HisIE [Bacillota bacterium]
MNEAVKAINWNHHGLVPAVAYDVLSGQVVMVAYMNREALTKTLETGYAHYYSRSRKCLWKKGETSGHLQRVKSVKVDCDEDAVLLEIEQTGASCHTGEKTCFYRQIQDGRLTEAQNSVSVARGMAVEYAAVKERAENPVEGSYTNYLLDKGIDKILKKVGEECTEVVIAAKNRSQEEVTYETADLIYHLSVMLYDQGLTWDDIGAEIIKRREKEKNKKPTLK